MHRLGCAFSSAFSRDGDCPSSSGSNGLNDRFLRFSIGLGLIIPADRTGFNPKRPRVQYVS